MTVVTAAATDSRQAPLQRRFGVCGSALQGFTSYLADWTQVLCMNGSETHPIPVQCSVPQGSVLGPVKFISCTEDVGSVSNQHGVRHHLYADDKQAYVDVCQAPQEIATARSVLINCIMTSAVSVRQGGCSSTVRKLNCFCSAQDTHFRTSTRKTRRCNLFHRHRTCQSCVRPRSVYCSMMNFL